MKIPITLEIVRKGNWYIARAVELDFVTQGRTPEEAKKNLMEVISIQFEEMARDGVLEEYLEECGYTRELSFTRLFRVGRTTSLRRKSRSRVSSIERASDTRHPV